MPDTYNFITKQWGCVPRPEREANVSCAAQYALVGGYRVVAIVTALFAVFSPSWAAKRQQEWEKAYAVQKTTITISGVNVEVYVCNKEWMRGLRDCRLSGGCSLTAPYTAPLNFVNGVVPLAP